MLCTAGQLDLQAVDSTVGYLGDQATAVGKNKNRRRTDFCCRSVYLPVIRNDLPELFDVFDFADPHVATGMRPRTMVATQGLFMLNDEMVMDAARATAQRLLDERQGGEDDEALVNRMFELIFNVPASAGERAQLLSFIQETRKHRVEDGREQAERRAWSMACHAMFASSRFQILE